MNALAEAAGQATERMTRREMGLAILRLDTAFPENVERLGADSGREALRNGARAIMQLWRDLENRDCFEACADALERRNRARKPRRLEHA